MTSYTASSSLDLNLIRYLVALVQEKSVSKAAQKMMVTQPAVSAALKRLRAAFEDPILVRSGQSMQATPRAIELAYTFEQMLIDITEMALEQKKFEPALSRKVFTLIASDFVQFAITVQLNLESRHYPRLLNHDSYILFELFFVDSSSDNNRVGG